ncbi:MAG: DUF1592 domain-containing protein [Verrucomicrobiales bacterium]|nr:DUF1592 domain-containing protein [Verrucomicrobiales bacterium]
MYKAFPKSLLFLGHLLLAGSIVISGKAIDLENHPGKAIYQKLCLECHGATGEGADDLDVDPLVGTRTIESLAGRIDRTMPEDEEHLCVGDDAKKVAEYVYHAFYSPEAQAKLQPVTTELTRLTAPQLQNSVTDLIGSFLNPGHNPEITNRGLKGSYTLDDRKRAGNNDYKREQFDRIDPQIRFDFGSGIPELPEGKESKMTQFRITWRGSIYARDTGIYEFTLRTRNGAKLYINEHDTKLEPTIDAWVAPNNEVREESEKVKLLGGRRYYVTLEFFKYKEEKSLIELLWKTPHGPREPIPNRYLTTDHSHPVFVAQTTLPADDRSYGYERGSSVSRVWLDALTSTAFEAADHVIKNLDRLARTKDDDPEREKKLKDFAAEFTSRAFRRPLRGNERDLYVEKHFRETESLEDAIRRTVIYGVTSPYFLYPGTSFDSPRGPWARASALALSLWDSLPDQKLRNHAQNGNLEKPKFVEQEAWRMLHDGRARNKMNGFFEHWLELSRADDMAKDTQKFPDYSDGMLTDLRTSLDLFIEDIVWSEASDYRKLLLSDHLYLNGRLGKIYGKPDLKGGFQKVSLPAEGRTGVITHPFLLTAFSYHNNTSPIHRGVFLTKNIVGLPLKPPPEAIEFEDSKFPPNLTMREKVTEMTRAKACMACHSMINPLGFSLEKYDAIGRWRTEDQGKPIDDDSVLRTDYGNQIDIKGPRDVAEYAANSPAAHAAFIRQLFHHATKQPLLAYGVDTEDRLVEHFRNTNFNIRHLLVEIAVTATNPSLPDS